MGLELAEDRRFGKGKASHVFCPLGSRLPEMLIKGEIKLPEMDRG